MPFPISLCSAIKSRYIISLCASALLLSACGGTGDDLIGSRYDINVALASSGSSVTANYDQDSADNVIDGDNSTASDWAGNASNDNLKIDFGQLRQISQIKIFSNGISNNMRIDLSSNNSTWFDTLQNAGVDIPCTTVTSNSTSITCDFAERKPVRYLRFTALTNSLLNVYEIEVTGY